MADKIKKTDIYIQKEQGNLMVIDPNKVYDENQKPTERYVPQEDLVYYVNLEANPVPRSILDLGEDTSSVKTTVAYGKVNYLGPNEGKPLDTSWTDDFKGTVNSKTADSDSKKQFYTGYVDYDYTIENQYDTQLLGIKDIQIETKPDSLKTSIITIRMVDVRGRALFEKGPSSIYSTFFHLPYPQFNLTIKGYYGEAITYQMVLSGQVKTSFENDGDYYVTATFMATNQKLLNDIRLGDVDVAPYLFQYDKNVTGEDGTVSTCKSTKGYDILKDTYRKYYEENLVDVKLSEKPLTLNQFVDLVDRLGMFLEDEMFDKTDISFFSDITRYGAKLGQFNTAINNWFNKFMLTNSPQPIEGSDNVYLEFKKEFKGGIKKNSDDKNIDIIESENIESLFKIFDDFIKVLSEINYFGKYKEISVSTNKSGGSKKIEYTPPSLSVLNKSDFYFNKSKKQMTIDVFITKLDKVFNQYTEAFESVKDQVEEVISTVQYNELGFKPTLKNVMGIILANTETFLRVMEYTHREAYNQRSNPNRLSAIDNKDNPDSVNDIVYPFPTVYKRNRDGKVEECYPGDPSIKYSIKSYDPKTWPEVKLVEEYVTNQLTVDNEKLSADFCFDTLETLGSKEGDLLMSNIFANDIYDNGRIYDEKSYVELIYRIYNRTLYSTFGTGYSLNTIKKLGIADAKNASNSINKLLSGKSNFKGGNITTLESLFGSEYLPKDITLIEDAREYLLTSSLEKDVHDINSYTVVSLNDVKTKEFKDSEKVLLDEAKKYTVTGLEPYPFSYDTWSSDNLSVKTNIYNRKVSTKYDNTLRYTYTSSSNDLMSDTFFLGNEINPLQTPKFVETDSQIAKSFWFLNTIPTKDLTGLFTDGSLKENYFARFLGGDVKEISKIQLLKWGSIWYRYTTALSGNDILDDVWGDLDITGFTSLTIGSNTFNYNTSSPTFDIGFYPELVVKKLNELVEDEEYSISDLSDLHSNGSLKLRRKHNYRVTDTNQTINVWETEFVKDGKEYVLPGLHNGSADLNIVSSDINKLINDSVSEDWLSTPKFMDFSGMVKPSTEEYVFDENGLLVEGKSIEDLTSLFSYETLESFKEEFINFSKDKDDSFEMTFKDVYHKLLVIEDISSNETAVLNSTDNIKNILDSTINTTMFITLHSPIDVSFSTLNTYVNTDSNTWGGTNTPLVKLILGPNSSQSIFELKELFFELSDIEVNEENLKKYKGLVNVWVSWVLNNGGNIDADSVDSFKILLSDIIGGFRDKMNVYVNSMFTQLNTLVTENDENIGTEETVSSISSGIELQKIAYRNLKNVNDTWVGGFNWDKVSLAKLFKYVNYLNEPIGDEYIMDVRVIKDFYNATNKQKSIGSFISNILKKNSLSEPMSFASNINFYGNLTSDVKNITESKKVANSIFGIHNSVNRNGLPGFVVFFRSNVSEYLTIKRLDYGYKSDSMDLTSSKPDPLSSKVVDEVQVREGGRGIAFNVDFGIQHQNMFSDFTINAYDGIKSGEELIVYEEISNSKNSSSVSTISTNLLDVMKTRVYSCSIKMIGNAMIQPFMYFNLRYIPIYSGTYMILSVQHTLSPDSGMITTFTGVRVSMAGISKIDKGMVKSRRNLLENLMDKLTRKANQIKAKPTPKLYSGDTNNQGWAAAFKKYESGNGERSCSASEKWGNIPQYDVPNETTKLTNGELKSILLESANVFDGELSETAQTNLARFTFSVSRREQGRPGGVRFLMDNPFGLHVDGGGTKTFIDSVQGYFCPMTSDGYVRPTAIFHNPFIQPIEVGITNAYAAFMNVMKKRGETYFGDSNFWESSEASDPRYLASLWSNYWNTYYGAIKGGNAKGSLVSDTTLYPNGIVRYTNGSTKDRGQEENKFRSFMVLFNKPNL